MESGLHDKSSRDVQDTDDGLPQDDTTYSSGDDERKLLRKLDLHLIPLVMALYLFSFLDR